MSRVLVTGGTGAIGSKVVLRLLADPAYDVRVADRKAAPQWMREGCEIRIGDLREHEHAAAAVRGCDQVVHLAAPSEDGEYSLITAGAALDSAVLRAAIDHGVQRFVYVSCATETNLQRGSSTVLPAHDFTKLLGERLCQAAQSQHGLPFVVCTVPRERDASAVVDAVIAALA